MTYTIAICTAAGLLTPVKLSVTAYPPLASLPKLISVAPVNGSVCTEMPGGNVWLNRLCY